MRGEYFWKCDGVVSVDFSSDERNVGFCARSVSRIGCCGRRSVRTGDARGQRGKVVRSVVVNGLRRQGCVRVKSCSGMDGVG